MPALEILLFYILIIVWIWFIFKWGSLDLFGGDNQVDKFNKEIQFASDVFYFKRMPDIIYNGDTPSSKSNCSVPVLVESSTNCANYCHEETAELFEVKENQIIYNNNYKLKPGYYCRIGAQGICNPYTTITVYSNIGWTCYNKTSEFGGLGGNKILICNGELTDTLLNKKYVKYIDPNIPLTDINERTSDGSFRFQCASEISPFTKYHLTNVLNGENFRFVRITNPCTLGMENVTVSKWNPDTRTCDCGEFRYDSEIQQCTNCPVAQKEHTALQCVACHEKYFLRTRLVNLLPCLYGPHLFVFLPAAKSSKLDDDDINSDLTKNISYSSAMGITDGSESTN